MIDVNDIGKPVRVSDGTPRPPERFNRKLAAWKNRNYDGILEKVEPSYHNPSRLVADIRMPDIGGIIRMVYSGVPIEKITLIEEITMKTVSTIYAEFMDTLPDDIRHKYEHLSFVDMADMPECQPYRDRLIQWEHDWNEAEKEV